MSTNRRVYNGISNIFLKVYQKRNSLASRKPQPVRKATQLPYYFPTSRFSLTALYRNNVFLIWAAIISIGFSILAPYYYNLLVIAEQNMLSSHADVDALLQRRNDIAGNLSKAVQDYSDHEKRVLNSIVAIRARAKDNAAEKTDILKKLKAALTQNRSGSETAAIGNKVYENRISAAAALSGLAGINAIAEQYPDLKLATNFKNLMDALIEVEKDLASERIKLNKQINTYTTYMAKFPCFIFARMFGFNLVPYSRATHEAKQFKLISFQKLRKQHVFNRIYRSDNIIW